MLISPWICFFSLYGVLPINLKGACKGLDMIAGPTLTNNIISTV